MEELLDGMRQRMPWTVAKAVLQSIGISPGHGWEKTLEKQKGRGTAALEGALRQALEEHVLCGEKFTKIYAIGAEEKKEISQYLETISPEETKYMDVYPRPLSRDELDGMEKSAKIIKIIKNTDGIGAVYACPITITVREEIVLEDYTTDAEKLNKYFDTVVGLRNDVVQVFSVIWLPHHHDFLEVRVDYPHGMASEEVHAIHAMIRTEFNATGLIHLGYPVELFGVLESIYDDESEGRVVELGFLTTTASVKLERMRKQNMDLRQEKYHISGKKGLGTPIEPYRISVRWTIDQGEVRFTPELSLAGTARGRSAVGSPGGVGISGAAIRNCGGRADYEHVMERVRYHFNKE